MPAAPGPWSSKPPPEMDTPCPMSYPASIVIYIYFDDIFQAISFLASSSQRHGKIKLILQILIFFV